MKDLAQEAINRVLKAIQAIKDGKMIIMVDDENRENEGDLICAADKVTPEVVNFMAKEGRGLICLTLAPQIVDRLKLPLMRDLNKTHASMSTAFTVSIEARHGVTTGISAQDRATTIKVAIDPQTRPEDLVVPGHIFPLRAVPGGVLERAGHTEGSVDLATLAGLTPAGVICEIMKEDGTMARLPDLEKFAEKFAIPLVSIEDLITYRLLNDSLIQVLAQNKIITSSGEFDAYLFKSQVDAQIHLALVKGSDFGNSPVDVRVHNQRIFSDVFGGSHINGRQRIEYGLNLLQNSKQGVLIYLNKISDENHLLADFEKMAVPTSSPDKKETHHFSMDQRSIGIGAQILRYLGVKTMRLHVTSPLTLKGIRGFGLTITEVKYLDS